MENFGYVGIPVPCGIMYHTEKRSAKLFFVETGPL
jgi:hypothetical protein